jgi:hypothetical protein
VASSEIFNYLVERLTACACNLLIGMHGAHSIGRIYLCKGYSFLRRLIYTKVVIEVVAEVVTRIARIAHQNQSRIVPRRILRVLSEALAPSEPW